jgi:hypothetical protein
VQPAFALYRWSGKTTQAAVLLRPLDAGSFRPEAMFVDPQQQHLVLLSDDGDELLAGQACKDKSLPPQNKSFRARRIKLPL